MNSTTIDDYREFVRQFLESMSKNADWQPRVVIPIVLVLIVVLLIVLCALCTSNRRDGRRMWRVLLRLANERDSSMRTIASPNKRGQFETPVWCNVCNEHIDHVDNLCPHIGPKLYRSALDRQLYRKWRQQLLRRHRSIGRFFSRTLIRSSSSRPTVNITAANTAAVVSPAAEPNITIDLNELLCQGKLERCPSSVTLDSLAVPCQTSTPDGKPRRTTTRQRSRLSNVRGAIQSWATRRRRSSSSSGIGESIASVEDIEADHPPPTFVKRFMAKPRRSVSDLISGGRSAHPVPRIVVEPCSPERRRRQSPDDRIVSDSPPSIDDCVKVNMVWNGPRSCGGDGVDFSRGVAFMRRAFSESSDCHDRPNWIPTRSISTTGFVRDDQEKDHIRSLTDREPVHTPRRVSVQPSCIHRRP